MGTRNNMKRVCVSILILLAASLSLGAAGETYRNDLTLRKDGEVQIKSDVPDITIIQESRGDSAAVTLTGAARDRYSMTVREDRDGIFVEVKRKQRLGIDLFQTLDAHLTVTLPNSWTEGELSVSTVSGQLKIPGPLYAEEVELHSVSGSIGFDSLSTTDSLEIASVSGSIEGKTIEAGDVGITSVSGAIMIDKIISTSRSDVEVGSVSGAIKLPLLDASNATVESISGAISVTLPRTFGGRVSASSLSGSISTSIDGVHDLSTEKRTQTFAVGNGSASLEVSTTSGAIRIAQ
ncbi:MAG TPA: hypothetical protein DHV69_09355 [Sphaerochaeta sp.]|nr:hypothetical protein [Sphaerochaeta sp.]